MWQQYFTLNRFARLLKMTRTGIGIYVLHYCSSTTTSSTTQYFHVLRCLLSSAGHVTVNSPSIISLNGQARLLWRKWPCVSIKDDAYEYWLKTVCVAPAVSNQRRRRRWWWGRCTVERLANFSVYSHMDARVKSLTQKFCSEPCRKALACLRRSADQSFVYSADFHTCHPSESPEHLQHNLRSKWSRSAQRVRTWTVILWSIWNTDYQTPPDSPLFPTMRWIFLLFSRVVTVR